MTHPTPARPAALDPLETRLYMKAPHGYPPRVLTQDFHGTRRADTIVVQLDARHPSKIAVVVNGVGTKFDRRGAGLADYAGRPPAELDINIDAGLGDDTITIAPDLAATFQINIYTHAGGGNDTVTGGSADGGPGDDLLTGSANADFLWGDDGNDTLLGLAGDDTLIAGYGDDLLRGGDGNDDLTGDDPTTWDRTIRLHIRESGHLLPAGNDTLFGDAGDDRLLGDNVTPPPTSRVGNNLLTGGTGHDTFVRPNAADTTDRDADDDVLTA